jgi:adenosine deaminase CECR1
MLNTLRVGGASATPARVGHGIALFKTPDLLRRYRRAGIALELCPISNQLLRYLVDVREHPGQIYLGAGLPCSLNPDDPAIFGIQGVSHDFWEACVAWNLDLKALKLLAYYSLRYSALGEREKDERIGLWLDQWRAFAAWLAAGASG